MPAVVPEAIPLAPVAPVVTLSPPQPEPPLARPGLVAVDKINGADTAWMMTSTALVLLMTLPGIALFYGGLVRRKSVINTLAA